MDNKLFTKVPDSIFAQLSIRACYLFGSRVTGNITSESDYDIAVFVDNVKTVDYKMLSDQLTDIFVFPEKLQLSIVDSTNTSPVLLMQIIRKGKLLYEQTIGYHVSLEAFIMRQYFDDNFRINIYYEALKQKYANR